VVCCVKVAVVGVSVKCKSKRDGHVSNLYIFQQKYKFRGIYEGQFLMVTQKIVTCKFNHCVVCLLLLLFCLRGVVCCVEVAIVGVFFLDC